MKSSDRFLRILVAGFVGLAIGAFVLARSQPDPTYSEGLAPEDVVHNYLLALQKNDYVVALAQLSPNLDGRPKAVEEMRRELRRSLWQFPTEGQMSVGLTVLSTDFIGDAAYVEVRLTERYDSGLFADGRRTEHFEMVLERTGGEWKITDGDRFFLHCWRTKGCQ